MNIKVLRNILEANDQCATRNREQLAIKKITAINLISAVTILLSNLTADVIYAVIDPRIKYS